MLRPEFPGVNHKRDYRLYIQANPAVRRRKKVKRPASERVPLQLAQNVNEVWSMDFSMVRPQPQARTGDAGRLAFICPAYRGRISR